MSHTATLHNRAGAASMNVHQIIRSVIGSEPPELVWIEPAAVLPRPGQSRRLAPGLLLTDRNEDTFSHPLEEARVFWPARGLHVLADGYDRCRWFEYGIDTALTQAALPGDPVAEWTSRGVEPSEPEPVLLRTSRDLERFGQTPGMLEKVLRTRYWEDTPDGSSLLAWHLRKQS